MQPHAICLRPRERAVGGRSRGQVGLAGEGVGVELAFRQAGAGGEVVAGGPHHGRSAAGIDLVAGEIGAVLQHGFMHVAGAALPAIFGLGGRDDGHVSLDRKSVV